MSGYGTYDKWVLSDHNCDDGLAGTGVAALALEASAGVKRTWTIYEPVEVTRVGIHVTVAFAYATQTAEGVITFKKYVAYGSSAGAVTLGRFALTDATPAGEVLFVDVNTKDGRGAVKTGEQIVAEITTAATGGGGIAGDFRCYVCWNPRAEVAGNQAYMTKATDTAT